ncbi:hypothetical protein J6590_034100 [Homalodisca vitripennis]|nr:hypothetical protein J6590_034100 [Homalodisca vitripennis]
MCVLRAEVNYLQTHRALGYQTAEEQQSKAVAELGVIREPDSDPELWWPPLETSGLRSVASEELVTKRFTTSYQPTAGEENQLFSAGRRGLCPSTF